MHMAGRKKSRMNTIKVNKKNVLMVAHRGVSGLEPENSIPAFIAAGNRSYYGVETDIHVTSDGKFVVIHDDQTGRVAGDNICVEEASYDLLKKLNLYDVCRMEINAGITGAEKGKRADLFIPSLADYVNICKKYNKKCVLELKNPFKPEDIVRMVEEIKELDYLDGMIFISFSYENMVALRKLLPEQPLQFLTSKADEELVENLNKYDLDLDIYYTALTKEIIDTVHAQGHKVNAWTCDSKEDAERLIDWGVDFITSNILE